jgi:transcriptional regulator with XRE-family HTH domain
MPRTDHDTLAGAPPGSGDLPFHLRLRFRREAAGLRQWELAEALGVHNTLLSAYENGRREPADPARFEAEVADAVARVQAGLPREAPASASPRFEFIERGLSLEAANSCIALVGRIAAALDLEIDAILRKERRRRTYAVTIRMGETPALPGDGLDGHHAEAAAGA